MCRTPKAHEEPRHRVDAELGRDAQRPANRLDDEFGNESHQTDAATPDQREDRHDGPGDIQEHIVIVAAPEREAPAFFSRLHRPLSHRPRLLFADVALDFL
jgi:hypothetical protein